MKVWVVYQHTEYTEGNFSDVIKIVDSEQKAIDFIHDLPDNNPIGSLEYTYAEFEVE